MQIEDKKLTQTEISRLVVCFYLCGIIGFNDAKRALQDFSQVGTSGRVGYQKLPSLRCEF